MGDIRKESKDLSSTISDAVSKLHELVKEAYESKVEAESFVLALVSHPAFDAVRVADVRARADKYREGFSRARRAERCLRFLEYIAQNYEDSELMHPLARLFKHKISPSSDSEGNARFFQGDTVMEAIESWANSTSFRNQERSHTRDEARS